MSDSFPTGWSCFTRGSTPARVRRLPTRPCSINPRAGPRSRRSPTRSFSPTSGGSPAWTQPALEWRSSRSLERMATFASIRARRSRISTSGTSRSVRCREKFATPSKCSASRALRFANELHTTWDVSVPHGRTEDLVDVIVGLHPSIELFQGVSTGDATGSVHISSPVSQLTGRVEFDLKDTRYYGRRIGNGKVVLRFVNGESMILDRATFSGPFAAISAAGTYSFQGPLDYQFRADKLSLAELVGVERSKKLGLSGTATLVGKAAGDATTPEVTAYLHSPQVSFGDRGSSEGHLEGRIFGRELQIWGRPFKDTKVSSKV